MWDRRERKLGCILYLYIQGGWGGLVVALDVVYYRSESCIYRLFIGIGIGLGPEPKFSLNLLFQPGSRWIELSPPSCFRLLLGKDVTVCIQCADAWNKGHGPAVCIPAHCANLRGATTQPSQNHPRLNTTRRNHGLSLGRATADMLPSVCGGEQVARLRGAVYAGTP
jgi:hypothetical protein